MLHPKIIQGGMGAGVSDWRLARAVSQTGHLGVVSGTALAVIFARRLQIGDPGGHMRRALAEFPVPGVAAKVLADYFIPGGKSANAPFKFTPLPGLDFSPDYTALTVAANFAEVFLAKAGHDGLVGINFLEKIQFPTLPSIFGSMLAGVDYVLMGAGIPRVIPGVLDLLTRGETATLKIDVEGALPGEEFHSTFDPAAFCGGSVRQLKRPHFLGIIASATLAMTLARKSSGRVDGFVVEGETAGGHNAPPRGPMQLNAAGKLEEALRLGAAGIQVGTAFAFCEESGVRADLKQQIFALSREGTLRVFTDPLASPTGFPFKVVQLPGTLSDAASRSRRCDLGFLRRAYRKADGAIGYRCPAEPVDDYVRKGGTVEETRGRICVCNGLLATIGLGHSEFERSFSLPLVTAGNEIARIARFLPPEKNSYSAADVVGLLLGQTTAA